MEKSLIEEVSENLGSDPSDVSAILDEAFLCLHRRIFEYKGLNGDYLGEAMHFEIGDQAFYHLMGFLGCYGEKRGLEKADTIEFMLRIGGKQRWLPFEHQIESWTAGK